MAINTISDRLRELVQSEPDQFPGSDPDARCNARKYKTAIDNLYDQCKEYYGEAAQAALKKDIASILERINSNGSASGNEVRADLNRLFLEKLRYLNGHGPKHLHAIDSKVLTLCDACKIELTPYEVFFVAAAAIVHDAGLIFGREGHELKIKAILEDHAVGLVTQERDTIENIASAHGGYVPGSSTNKAKLDVLNVREQVQGKEIRCQLLAALVRFADELAEDHSRALASSKLTKKERRELLGGSEVYHVYSTCLQPCMLDSEERVASLQFLLNYEDVINKFLKGSTEVYILDEIYERTIKCFAEMTYCGRFIYEAASGSKIRPITEIRVSIEVAAQEETGNKPIQLRYTLKERGYPTWESKSISELAPDLVETMRNYATGLNVATSDTTACLRGGPTGTALAQLLDLAKVVQGGGGKMGRILGVLKEALNRTKNE